VSIIFLSSAWADLFEESGCVAFYVWHVLKLDFAIWQLKGPGISHFACCFMHASFCGLAGRIVILRGLVEKWMQGLGGSNWTDLSELVANSERRTGWLRVGMIIVQISNSVIRACQLQ